jgi:hypothetical protein
MKNLVAFYVGMIIIFAIYGTFWSDHAFQGFFWNLKHSVFWPKIMFRGLWEIVKEIIQFIVGAIFLLGYVGYVMSRKS